MILVDTSSWIHFLRPDGNRAVRARVVAALEDGSACWCPVVRLELWNGIGGVRERAILTDFERVLQELPITAEVWNDAHALARRARLRGVTVPATDILISACASFHDADIETADADFARLAQLDR